VVADAIAAAGADRLVVVDRKPGLEAQCRIRVKTLSGGPNLAHELADALPDAAVVVANNRGAVKRGRTVRGSPARSGCSRGKQRDSGAAVSALEIAGDVHHRSAVIVDVMITNGATIKAAVGLLPARAPTVSWPPPMACLSMPP
jgi:ribose-phosphate pyrophosphokinase